MSKEMSHIDRVLVENKIFIVRGQQIMIDSDLADLYQVSTGRLNEQVKRNIEKFPKDFMFQLTDTEWKNLKSQNAISSWGGRRINPFVFTEQGVASLSGIVKSKVATKVNIAVMRTFVQMRKTIGNHQQLLQLSADFTKHTLEMNEKFEQVFKALEGPETEQKQGVFF